MPGVINVYQEFFPPYDRKDLQIVAKIYERLPNLQICQENKMNTQLVANRFAEERIRLMCAIHASYLLIKKVYNRKKTRGLISTRFLKIFFCFIHRFVLVWLGSGEVPAVPR